jgi:hypothetical protein
MTAGPFAQVGNLPRNVQAMLEETLLVPPSGVELQRTPARDYMHRLFAPTPHVAELFQENTKISPHASANVPLDESTVEAVRQWYLSTAYQPREGDVDERMARELRTRLLVEDLDAPIKDLLASLGGNQEAARLMYALDLWVLIGEELFRLAPQFDVLWQERTLERTELQDLKGSLIGLPGEELRFASALLFVAATAWRYMLFQGPRGYRRALIDMGRFLSLCEAEGERAGIRLSSTLDFHDARVDRLLLLDGVERSTMAVIALGEEVAQ